MLKDDNYPAPPSDGVYTRGLFLEGSLVLWLIITLFLYEIMLMSHRMIRYKGARWDRLDGQLAESLPKILFSPAPTMHWKPYRKHLVPKYPHYKCPVYKTSDRRYRFLVNRS
jgi:dynein heavy chain